MGRLDALLGWLRATRRAPPERAPPEPPPPASPPARSLYREAAPVPEDTPWPPGPRFAGWTLVKVMEQDGRGYVRYLVDPPGSSGTRCALACFAPNPDDPHLEMRFDELGVTRLLSHPNLERVVDRGGGDGRYWHLTERPPGPTARALRPRGPGSPRELDVILAAFADFAEGLHAAHTLVHDGAVVALCHRWLTPGELLLGADGVGRVVDWGLMDMIRLCERSDERTRLDDGMHHLLPYVAPEQARGDAVDGRANVHALGAMLHELSTGRPLFRGDSDLRTLENVLRAAPAPPTTLVPGYPPALEELVLRALAKEPAGRPTAGELGAGLRELLAARGVTDPAARIAAYVRTGAA
jgi:serine/threonine protein kinase